MGTIDSNGIYFYEDTDAVSPLHTLLNVGQQSVSDALITSIGGLSWVAGWSGVSAVRRYGPLATMQFGGNGVALSANQVFATVTGIPFPSFEGVGVGFVDGGGTRRSVTVIINTSGQIRVTTTTGMTTVYGSITWVTV